MVDLTVGAPIRGAQATKGIPMRVARLPHGAGWMAAAALAVGLTGYTALDRMIPVATATARLAVAQGSDDAAGRAARVAAASQMLHSPEFLRTVIRRLNAEAAARLDDDILVPDNLAARLFSVDDGGLPATTAVEERRVSALGAALSVSPSTSETVSLSLAADNPSAAATALNAVLDTYVSLASSAPSDAAARIVAPAAVAGPRSAGLVGGLAALAGAAAAALTGLFLRRRARAAAAFGDMISVPSAPPVVGAVPVDVRVPTRGKPAGRRRAEQGGERFWTGGHDHRALHCLAVIGVGGTEASAQVARMASSAAEETPAVLIDLTGELQAPRPANALGFGGLLAGEVSFAEVIARDPQRRFHVLAGCPDDLGVASERLDAVIEALVHAYDRVVIHLPPSDIDRLAARVSGPVEGIVLATDRDACAPGVQAAFDRLTSATRRPVTVAAIEGCPVRDLPAAPAGTPAVAATARFARAA